MCPLPPYCTRFVRSLAEAGATPRPDTCAAFVTLGSGVIDETSRKAADLKPVPRRTAVLCSIRAKERRRESGNRRGRRRRACRTGTGCCGLLARLGTRPHKYLFRLPGTGKRSVSDQVVGVRQWELPNSTCRAARTHARATRAFGLLRRPIDPVHASESRCERHHVNRQFSLTTCLPPPAWCDPKES